MAEESILEQTVPQGFLKGIKFDMMVTRDIEKMSNVNIMETSDVTNPKLGLPNGSSQCATCGFKSIRDCDGHFGAIKLPMTIYHPYFISELVQILSQICPGCLSIKQDLDNTGSVAFEASDKSTSRHAQLLQAIQKNLNGLQKKQKKMLFGYLKRCVIGKQKKRVTRTSKQATCKYCSRSSLKWYPAMRFKILSRDTTGRRSLSIVAEICEKIPKRYQNKSIDEVLPGDYWDFVPRDIQQQEPNRSRITLTPYQAFTIVKQLDPEFVEQFVSNRKLLFISTIPVTANNHRVSEAIHSYSDGPKLTFDERTKAYKRIVDSGRKIEEFRHHQQFKALAGSLVTNRVMECLSASKLHSRQSNNGERPTGASYGVRWLKDIILSKRTDHVLRTVMVGDPNVKLHEIGIPADLAENLLVTEQVNSHNIEKLNNACNFHLISKGQLHARRNGLLVSIRKPDSIEIGDMVYRPMENGDIILINRPPSVHQHSLIGLSVKILPTRYVTSINPLCCLPLLGDFDGDCLHGYVPQSVRCRVELSELVSLDHQLFNSQDGKCLVSLSHDSLVASSILTGSDIFLNKYEMQQLEMHCFLSLLSPIPSIVKPISTGLDPAWTGTQLFSRLLPPDLDIDLISKNLCVRNGEVLLSPTGSSFWLQNGNNSIFSVIFKKYGKNALDYLSCAQEALCEYLSMRGLTVSLSDLYLSPDQYSRKVLSEEVCIALEEAESALKTKQFMLNPKSAPFLKSFDYESEQDLDLSAESNPYITRISIGAFKDVFIDVLKLANLYVRKDNSMLAMIQSGSKGSIMKLVQQSVCLGLQLPVNSFPFTVPRDLSCDSWNIQKLSGECNNSSYAVVKSSFFDGLNPLECLIHAISGRANFFSENAEVPGTLNRELMYYLRDLYVAYDGTVRDSYGQRIVQFEYGDSSCDEIDGGDRMIGGQVGAWAACAISEAAYGALDYPVNSLEESPLMNLKKVLKCDKGRTCTDHAAVLFLSNHLQKYRYGPEYGALEIKNHLERVDFSDLVNSITVLYTGRDAQGLKNSPWSTHFHISKEIMRIKRSTLKSVIDRLKENYSYVKRKSDGALPTIRISKSICSMEDTSEKNNETVCITVAAETSDLETIKHVVIPLLLKATVKGFVEFERVEIKCEPDHCGELYIRVTMSENCGQGKFWNVLQNGCIPIMDLIDWERTRPDSVHDIFGVYGVDAAWTYFLNLLKSTTSDIGKEIKREHLLTVADSLSVSGEFHGLSSKGLKLQRKNLSVSAPFSQACFSGPASSFINAAKQGSVDNLSGTLDSLAWGKEPSIGSGGHFDIIYSQEGHFGKKNSQNQSSFSHAEVTQPKECENIYKFLQDIHIKEKEEEKNKPQSWTVQAFAKRRLTPSKSEDRKFFERAIKKLKIGSRDNPKILNSSNKVAKDTNYSVFLKHTRIGSWDNIVHMHSSLRGILYEYLVDECVSEAHKKSLIEALEYHPRGDEKIGTGVKDIKVGQSQSHDGSRCFIVIRHDGTTEDFSYRKCIVGAAMQISKELGSLVERAW